MFMMCRTLNLMLVNRLSMSPTGYKSSAPNHERTVWSAYPLHEVNPCPLGISLSLPWLFEGRFIPLGALRSYRYHNRVSAYPALFLEFLPWLSEGRLISLGTLRSHRYHTIQDNKASAYPALFLEFLALIIQRSKHLSRSSILAAL